MTGENLDEVIDALDPEDGETVLDLACGHGELLIRMAERSTIEGIGVDLSPWVLVRAQERAATRPLRGTIRWILGDGTVAPQFPRRAITTALGASWIWGGFAETIGALRNHTLPNGRIAVGDLRLRTPADRNHLSGRPEAAAPTEDEQREAFTGFGLEPVAQIQPNPEAWRLYHERVADSALAYANARPGDPSADYTAMARAWMENDYPLLTQHLTWTVWVARVV